MNTSPKAVNSGQTEREAFDWLETEISAVDTWHRGSPIYEHDANWMKERALKLVKEASEIFTSAASTQARAASTATAMLDVLHDSNRENDRAWSAENRVARAAAPQGAMDAAVLERSLEIVGEVLAAKEVMAAHGCKQAQFAEMFTEFVSLRAAAPQGLTDEHAEALYRLARMTDFAGWVKEFRQSAEQSAAPMAEPKDQGNS